MPRLSTHVLDTSRGKPAAGMEVRLYRCHAEARKLMTTAATNADGRLVAAEDAAPGTYELVFTVGAYFGLTLEAAFLTDVVVRFQIAEGAGSYHVPLLVSPYGYTTYRGS